MYDRERIIEILDCLIRDLKYETGEYFNIKTDISKYADLSDDDKKFLPLKVISFAKTYKLIENTLNSDDWFKLTEKGYELLEYGKGFDKYQKHLKRKLSPFEKLSILFIVIGFTFSVFQYLKNENISNEISELNKRVDILKENNSNNIKKIDSLNMMILLKEQYLKNEIESIELNLYKEHIRKE